MNRRLSSAANQKLREASREISGVNETVASGLSFPLSRPWLLVVPILLDLFLWIGIQIPITRITTPLAEVMIEQGGDNGELAADQLALLGETARVNDLIGSMIPSIFSGLSRENLFSVVTAIFAPGLTGGINRGELTSPWEDLGVGAWDPGSIAGILGLGVLFILVASLLAVTWRVPLALAVTQRRLSTARVIAYIMRSWMRFLALIGLIVLVACVLFVPLVLAAGVLLVLGLNMAALIALFLVMVGSLVAIYARFVLESIIVDDIGPLRALKRSALITQTFFGPSVRFSIATVLLASGALRLWDVMITSPPGLPIAIVFNSFLGTGLAVASMMFYYDRNLLLKKFAPSSSTASVPQTPL